MMTAMNNFHLPLDEDLHAALRREADMDGVPATRVARQALKEWLAARERARRDEAIRRYAEAYAGVTDLDAELEGAGVELMLEDPT